MDSSNDKDSSESNSRLIQDSAVSTSSNFQFSLTEKLTIRKVLEKVNSLFNENQDFISFGNFLQSFDDPSIGESSSDNTLKKFYDRDLINNSEVDIEFPPLKNDISPHERNSMKDLLVRFVFLYVNTVINH